MAEIRLNHLLLSTLVIWICAVSTGCGTKCNPRGIESVFTRNDCADDDPYFIYAASGFPLASGTGMISKWTKTGDFIQIIYDYSKISVSQMPQSIAVTDLNGSSKLLILSFDGTQGSVSTLDPGTLDYQPFFSNATALTAGTRRIALTANGGYLVTRTAGVEFFNSATQRIGAPLFTTSGTCTASASLSATEVLIGGSSYVVTANGAATPNNKLNLYNGTTGACISGAAPAGPASTVWPVFVSYVADINKLFALYYPFTGATSFAQIWSFDVSPTSISNGKLIYSDVGGNIAPISAAPGSLSSSLKYYKSLRETFFLIGTANNSIIKLNYDGTSLTQSQSLPLVYKSSLVKSISDIEVLSQ